ncbi:MAG: hypothetical protein N2C14_30240, partial [Planctomycetales bacterium]
MNLTFHIIFLPGMVRYLRLAVLSLLKHSPYRYRLVSNGLQGLELEQLREFCEISDRLELCAFPTQAILAHGVLLSVLQSREREPFFCFMDPDVFAADSFDAVLEDHLRDCDVFSSCTVLRTAPGERPQGYWGNCLEAPNGLPLATTFFAVYRNDWLREIIEKTQVGFEVCNRENFSPDVHRRLEALGLPDVQQCDTGKLLNLLSHGYGARIKYRPLDALTHVGGVSSAFVRSSGWKERVSRNFHRPYVLRDADFEIPWWSRVKRRMIAANVAEADQRIHRRAGHLKRMRIAAFFAFFLRSLVDGAPEPSLCLREQPLADQIDALC